MFMIMFIIMINIMINTHCNNLVTLHEANVKWSNGI